MFVAYQCVTVTLAKENYFLLFDLFLVRVWVNMNVCTVSTIFTFTASFRVNYKV